MKTNPANQTKIKILRKVAAKILEDNGFWPRHSTPDGQIYQQSGSYSTVLLSSRENSIRIVNLCTGEIPFFGTLMRDLLKDGRFVINIRSALVLDGNLSVSMDDLWDSISSYLTDGQIVQIFPHNRIMPPEKPLLAEEFI